MLYSIGLRSALLERALRAGPYYANGRDRPDAAARGPSAHLEASTLETYRTVTPYLVVGNADAELTFLAGTELAIDGVKLNFGRVGEDGRWNLDRAEGHDDTRTSLACSGPLSLHPPPTRRIL